MSPLLGVILIGVRGRIGRGISDNETERTAKTLPNSFAGVCTHDACNSSKLQRACYVNCEIESRRREPLKWRSANTGRARRVYRGSVERADQFGNLFETLFPHSFARRLRRRDNLFSAAGTPAIYSEPGDDAC